MKSSTKSSPWDYALGHAAIQQLLEASNAYDDIDFPFAVTELPVSTDGLPTTLLYVIEQHIVGLLAVYNWSGMEEVYGLVHPAFRRRSSPRQAPRWRT